MTKRAVAKTGEYEKDGAIKGEYSNIGVVLSNENGEYMLLDPGVSLAGLLLKQNALAMKQNKPVRDMVLIGFFSDENQQQAAPQQPQRTEQQYQNAPPQQNYQAPPQQQGGFGNPPQHSNHN